MGGEALPGELIRSPRRRRAVLVVSALVALLAAGLLIALPAVVALRPVQTFLQAEMSRRLDRPVGFDRFVLRYEPLPAVHVTGLRIASPGGFGPDPFLAVRDAYLGVRLRSPREGRFWRGELTLVEPRLHLEQRPDGAWNLPAALAARTAFTPLAMVSRLTLAEGRVEVRLASEAGPPAVYRLDDVALTLDDVGRTRPVRLRLTATLPGGGLALDVGGEVGPWADAGGDPASVPVRLTGEVRATGPAPPEGAGVWLAGTGGGTVRAEGRLGQLRGEGRLSFSRLLVSRQAASCPAAAPRTLTLEDVELPVRVAGGALEVQPFTLRVADGVVRGATVVAWRSGWPEVELTAIRIEGLKAERVLVDFLCHPYAVAGRLDGSGAMTLANVERGLWGPARGEWWVRVGPGRLAGRAIQTLVSDIARVGAAAGGRGALDTPTFVSPGSLDFQQLSATGTVEQGEVRAREIRWTTREARVAGEGRYRILDSRLDFRLGIQTGRRSFGVAIGGTAREPRSEWNAAAAR